MKLSRTTLSMFIQSYTHMNDYTNSKPYKINLFLLDVLDAARRGEATKEQYEKLASLYSNYDSTKSSYAFHTLKNEPNSQRTIEVLEDWLKNIERDIEYFSTRPDYNPFDFDDSSPNIKAAILE